MNIPSALVLGCNDPVTVGVLSDWILDNCEFEVNFWESGWDDTSIYGYGNGTGYGGCYGNGNGYGRAYGFGWGDGNGSGYGDSSGGGCGYGEGDGLKCSYGDGFGEGDGYLDARGKWFHN